MVGGFFARCRIPISTSGLVVGVKAVHAIDILTTLIVVVELSMVHRLRSTVRLSASQLLSHIGTHPCTKFFVVEGPVEESSSMSRGSMSLIAAVFTLFDTPSANFDSCSTSVDSHCMAAT